MTDYCKALKFEPGPNKCSCGREGTQILACKKPYSEDDMESYFNELWKQTGARAIRIDH